MNTHDHDNDALPGDDELKALYRSLPRKEPPAAMDRAIKRAAADAVRGTARRSAPRWPVAVASAAMVVVAAGLGWRMMQHPSNVPQIPTVSSAATSATPEPAVVPVQAAAPPPQAPAVAAAAAPSTPSAAKAVQQTTPPLSEHENIRSAGKPKLVARTVAPTPPPMAMESAAPVLPMAQDRANAAYSPPPAPAPPAPPAPPAQMQATPAEAPAAALARSATNAPMAGLSYHAAAARAMAAPAPALPVQDATAMNPGDTPEQELEKIRQLFAQQRHDEAMQRLAAFQKAHPELPLPADLRAQLPDHE